MSARSLADPVQFLNFLSGEFVQLDSSDAGNCLLLDSPLFVVPRSRESDAGLGGVQLEPDPQLLCRRVLSQVEYVQLLVFCDGYLQSGFHLRRGLAQHDLDNALAIPVVPGGVPPFPTSAFPLPDVSRAIGTSFCHYSPLLRWRDSQATIPCHRQRSRRGGSFRCDPQRQLKSEFPENVLPEVRFQGALVSTAVSVYAGPALGRGPNGPFLVSS